MTTIDVHAARPYSVVIAQGLLDSLGERAALLKDKCKVMVVADDTVAGLYAQRAVDSLESAGFESECFVFTHGENSKNLATYSSLLGAMAAFEMDRHDLVVALGGGVCGDLAGFAAATYMRGIDCIQLPTTLLAAVDSSVGGKTAIDLDAGKNLCGAFWQPRLVLCDTDTFSTLGADIYAQGMAETIKYGMLSSTPLFETLEKGAKNIENVVASCIRIKAAVVALDEFDEGRRQLLNFGHTVGHAIEKLSDYTVAHGDAVAVGMAMMTRACEKEGICESGTSKRLARLLKKYGLGASTEFSAKQLALAALNDKKRRGDRITLVMPVRVGHCELRQFDADKLEELFSKGMK